MDITNFIKRAINLDVNWRHLDFLNVIDILSKNYFINYEVNEEKIAVIQKNDDIVGYLYLKYPLFFIESEYFSPINLILNEYNYIQYIKVDSINHEYLYVDKILYDKYFDYMENVNNFSAQDFYFFNVN